MRLGLSTVLTAALAVGLMACSSSSGDGVGGSGGAGAGGDDSSANAGGGTTTSQGGGTGEGGGAGGGDTGDGACESTNVLDPDTECDVDCTAAIEGNGGVWQCTETCDPAVGCAAGSVCVLENEGDTEGFCLYDCEDPNVCPGSSEFVCDQDFLICIPDGVSQ